MHLREVSFLNLIESMSEEVDKAKHSLIILPAGSLEQHGTEAPLGCDGIIAEALCRKAGALSSTPVLPTLYYGYSYSHSCFPGTFSLSANTYSMLLCNIIDEAERNRFRQMLILSGHGGNRKAAEKAITCRSRSISVSYLGYWQLPGVLEEENRLFRKAGYHITSSEVSMVWYILSRTIPGRFSGTYPPAVTDMSTVSPEQWHTIYPDGGVGADLSDASVKRGRILFEFIVDSLVKTLLLSTGINLI
jgi:creatinine amidohydrolase/Fe(II)-dependent formamide hydrolase-like protein